MNILFLSSLNPNDINSWSGTTWHILETLKKGNNVDVFGTYMISQTVFFTSKNFSRKRWRKKGGDKALGAYKKLKTDGFQCSLTIIGSTPEEKDTSDDDNLVIIPFLDKSKPEHLERFCSILKETHFLILPTEFDASPIVFCEASAYGVPSIAADVCGVSQLLQHGKNGFLMSPDATADDYAEKIKSVFSDKEKYIELRKSSRREYETRLNWDVWGEKVNKILEETVKNYRKKDIL